MEGNEITMKDFEQNAWAQVIAEVIADISSQEVYQEYAVRERFLAFFYTLIESLTDHKDFAQYYLSSSLWPGWSPQSLDKASKVFQAYATELFSLANESGEVIERMKISENYPEASWRLCLVIMEFWRQNENDEEEQVDVFIEKSVNAFFDLTGPLAIDSILDFGKFVWQSRK